MTSWIRQKGSSLVQSMWGKKIFFTSRCSGLPHLIVLVYFTLTISPSCHYIHPVNTVSGIPTTLTWPPKDHQFRGFESYKQTNKLWGSWKFLSFIPCIIPVVNRPGLVFLKYAQYIWYLWGSFSSPNWMEPCASFQGCRFEVKRN